MLYLCLKRRRGINGVLILELLKVWVEENLDLYKVRLAAEITPLSHLSLTFNSPN